MATWKQRYVALLEEGVLPATAAKRVGVTRKALEEARLSDPIFDEQEATALELQADLLEGEAVRRAVEGIEKTVYFKGAPVGMEKTYSDTLLLALLKANRKKFTDKSEVTTNQGITVAIRDLAAESQVTVHEAMKQHADAITPELAPVIAAIPQINIKD